MLEFIDTHSHLYDDDFTPDFDQVIKRAQSAGVIKCIMPGIDISNHNKMMSCTNRLKNFAFPCIGLHPTSVGENWEDELDFVKENIINGKFYAVGEIGIDEYWSKEFISQQKEVFKQQIILAEKYDLPIIIHSREATEDIFDVLEKLKEKNIKGVFHAYSGSYETYERIKKYGDFKIGIGGVVTYKNAGIASVLKKIPLEEIVLETDSPWLTPVPYRGKRNESSYICIIAEKIAQIKEIPIDKVSITTTLTAKKLFNI
ncbi:MAG: TatD family hydrolase [Bacteroidales bacterium]|nr:TatD family hydrolase [Bacteroidales bacterium]